MCAIIRMPFGGFVLDCHRQRCPRKFCACGRLASRFCDFRPEREEHACDASLCERCAFTSEQSHFCARHVASVTMVLASTVPA